MAVSYTVVSAPAVTNLNSLASAAYWVSAEFDNDTNLAYEVDLFITILTTTTAGTTGAVKIYLAPSNDGGTDFAGGITTEADATYTPVGDDISHWDYLGEITYTSETTARTMKESFRVHDVPRGFKVVILNNTGTAFGSSTCAVEWNSVKY